MNLLALIKKLKQHNIRIGLDPKNNSKLQVSAAKGAINDELLQLLKEHKPALLTWAQEQQLKSQQTLPPITPRPTHQLSVPLSFNQRQLCFIDKLTHNTANYNMPIAFRLRGLFDLTLFEQAVHALMQRHDMFRCTLVEDDDLAHQIISDTTTWQLSVETINEKTNLDDLIKEEANKPFHLFGEPLYRTRLWRINQQQHIFMVTLHHIMADAASIDNLLHDLTAYYTAAEKQGSPKLTDLHIHYADYAYWQQQTLKAQGYLEQQIAYWEKQLASAPARLNLPTDRPRPEIQSHHGAVLQCKINQHIVQRSKTFAQENAYTPFMIYLAALQLLLGRYAGQHDVCIGTPISGRHHAGTENLVGFFSNTVIMRSIFNDNPSVEQYLQRVKNHVIEGFSHQDAPLDMILEKLAITRSNAYNPVAQIGFNYIQQTMDSVDIQSLSLDGLAIELIEHQSTQSKYDMIWGFQEVADKLTSHNSGNNADTVHISLEYNTDLFDPVSIEQYSQHFQQLLEHMLTDINAPVFDVAIMTKQAYVDKVLQKIPNSMQDTVASVFPLTPMQRDIYLDSLINSDQHNNQLSAIQRTSQRIQSNLLQQALNIIVSQHASLRMRIISPELSHMSPAYAVILKPESSLCHININNLDWSDHELEHCAFVNRCHQLAYNTADAINNPDQALMSCYLINDTEKSDTIVLSTHHIISDGISLQLTLKHLEAVYKQLLQKNHNDQFDSQHCLTADTFPTYPPQQTRLCDNATAYHFFLSQANNVEALNSPFINTLQQAPYQFTQVTETSTSEHLEKIQAYCKKNSVTLQHYLKAIYAVMLEAYCTPTNDFYFNEILAARPREQTQGIGCYFEQRPIVIHMVGNFPELLSSIKAYDLSVGKNKRLSNRLQKALFPQANTAFFFNFYTTETTPLFLDTPSSFEIRTSAIKNHINLVVRKKNDQLDFHLSYHTQYFDDLDFLQRFLSISQQIIDGTDNLADIKLQLDDEAIINKPVPLNKMAQDFTSVIHQFEQQAQEKPHHHALSNHQQRLDYQTLNHKANQLAHYLINEQRISNGERVVIYQRCHINTIISILAVLKTGASYIPISASSPLARIQHSVQDSQAKLILVDRAHHLPCEANIIDINAINETLVSCSTHNPGVVIQAEDEIYSIYTSGSSGLAKAAIITHASEANLVDWYTTAFDFNADDAFIIISAMGFDLTQKNILTPLSIGASIITAYADDGYHPETIIAAIKKHHVSVLNCAPSAAYPLFEDPQYFDDLQTLRWLILGGESINMAALMAWLQSTHCQAQLVNTYGPTECTDVCSFYPIESPQDYLKQSPPIGKANQHNQLFIVDPQLRILPPGFIGELLITGIGVSQGYINRPELNAAKFIHHPLLGKAYRTGDLVKQLSDGNIEFIRRIDQQLKIRGQRIESGDIEYALKQLKASEDSTSGLIKDCLIDSVDDQLTAYVIISEGNTVNDWQQQLSQHLTASVIPHNLVTLPRWPLTINGKIDRQALRKININKNKQYIAARTPTEEKLSHIWQEVLGVTNISMEATFFELGGHSLLAIKLINRIRANFHQELPLRDIFSSPTIASIAEQLDKHQYATATLRLTKSIRKDHQLLPLSYAQSRLWFIDQLDPGNTVYDIPFAIGISGEINDDALQQACRQLINRHEPLRTHIAVDAGQAHQLIAKPCSNHKINDALAIYTIDDNEQTLIDAINDFIHTPFDLSIGPLFRANLIHCKKVSTSNDAILLIKLHHIIADAWSMEMLIQELLAYYQLHHNKQHHSHTELEQELEQELKAEYVDYAIWQKTWLNEDKINKQLDYWLKQLEGLENLQLDTDFARPATLKHAGAQYAFTLPKELSDGIRKIAINNNVSLFMTLLAAFQLLLSKYSRQDDIAVGTPIANRPIAESEKMIGLFVNNLVIRTHIPTAARFTDYLKQVKTQCLSAFEHQDLPFELLVDKLNLPRELSQTPLFQVMFVLQNSIQSQGFQSKQVDNMQIKALPYNTDNCTAKFDLTLNMMDVGHNLEATIEYRTSLFKPATIARLSEHFMLLLENIINNSNATIDQLSITSDHDYQQQVNLHHGLNATQFNYPSCHAVHHLFERQAEKTPHAIAIIDENSQLNYEQLNQQANQLAHYLIKLGIKTNQAVGMCLQRGIHMSVSILAILKAGACYVPLDPELPEKRLAFIAADARFDYLISDNAVLSASKFKLTHKIYINENSINDKLSTPWHKEAKNNPNIASDPQHRFNIIYTSGSTGNPKGVVVPHQGIINLLQWLQHEYALHENDRVLQKTPYSFDVSVSELFWPITQGSRLIFAKAGGHKDPVYLKSLIIQHAISTVHFVPSMLAAFLQTDGIEQCETIRHVFASGEALTIAQAQLFYQRLGKTARLYNLYGPTEASVDVSYYDCAEHAITGDKAPTIPIGKPIHNTQLYIMDENQHILPIGLAGELYIGGTCLAQAYLNQQQLTAAAFIDNPFYEEQAQQTGQASKKLYRSGDLARLLSDGNIEYLGRIDQQINIRGFRIELGEIESQLLSIDSINDVIVSAQSNTGLAIDNRLVAYMRTQAELDALSIEQHLAQHLPSYMLPAEYHRVASWPLTLSGKIDRKALASTYTTATIDRHSTSYVAPYNELQKKLATLWQALLGKDDIGINDNFFAVGGHSLLAIQLAANIDETFSVQLSLRAMFESPTIAGLAQLIENTDLHESTIPSVQKVSREQDLPLSFNQERLWFIYKLAPQSTRYHISTALHLEGSLNIAALQKAIHHLIDRHEIFRTHFIEKEEQCLQKIMPTDTFSLNVETLEATSKDIVSGIIKQESLLTFDLSNTTAIRFKLWKMDDQQYLLIITMHHIISDALSMQSLAEEMTVLYAAYTEKKQAEAVDILPQQTIQYADYAWWQRHVLAEEALDAQLVYWKKQLKYAPTKLTLTTDHPRASQSSHPATVFHTSLSTPVLEKLRAFSLSQQLTPFMVLLAAQQLLLGRLAKQKDICIGVPIAGRHRKGLENLQGFFVNTLVMRTQFHDNPSVTAFFQRVKETVLGAFAHQDVPFEQILQAAQTQSSITTHNTLVQIGFNYLTSSNTSKQLACGDLRIKTLNSPITDAKYDMTWAFNDSQQGISLDIEYRQDLYNESSIQGIVSYYEQLLLNMFNDAAIPVDRISLMSESVLFQKLTAKRKDIASILPLSALQKDIYLDTIIDPNNRRNYFGWIQRTHQAIDKDLFQQAINRITRQLSALRMRILAPQDDALDIAYMGIVDANHPHAKITVNAVDWSSQILDAASFEQRCCDQFIFQPYDLEHEPNLRIYLIEESTEEHKKLSTIILTAHHSCIDGISLQNITEQYISAYEVLLNADSNTAESNEHVIEDNYLSYLRSQHYSCDNQKSLAFWQKKSQPIHALKARNALASSNTSANYHLIEHSDDTAHFDAISTYCKTHNTHITTYIKAIYALLLQSYCYADEDFYFTDIIAARPKQHRQSIGCYFEQRPTIITQQAMGADRCFDDLLHYLTTYRKEVGTQHSISTGQQHHLLPQSDTQFLFNFYLTDRHLAFAGKQSTTRFIAPEMANTVRLITQVDNNKLLFSFTYTDNVFTDYRFIERLLSVSKQILSGENRLAKLHYFLDDEAIEHKKNISSVKPRYQHSSVMQMIDEAIKANPDAIALKHANVTLTYQQLNQRANNIAQHLKATFHIKTTDRIAVCCHANSELVIAIVAIMKLGASYVPIDPYYPAGRIQHIIDDAACCCILTDGYLQHIPTSKPIDCVNINTIKTVTKNNITPSIHIDDEIYCLYTSGSTGLPKGVRISHRGEINLLQWYQKTFTIYANDRIGIISSISFDLTQKNILVALISGACIIFPERHDYDPEHIINTIKHENISLINCAPSAFYPLVATQQYELLHSLRLVLLGGESIRAAELLAWHQYTQGKTQLVNMYGPTECTDIASFYCITDLQAFSDPLVNQPIPIGQPNDHVKLYIVDSNLRILPSGFTGELLIAGEGLGLGYINQAPLNHSAFINHPSLGRVYRTGDLARQDQQGNYFFISRIDHQLKLRGLRIEPAEIEYALRQIKHVSDSLVKLENDKLVAYIINPNGQALKNWREDLAHYLPEYMLPNGLMALKHWPLTANGKIDRQALPRLESSISPHHEEAKTIIEKQLSLIWQDILAVDNISIHDTFFELGGHSLLAVRLINRIREQFNTELPLSDIFHSPTIYAIAKRLAAQKIIKKPLIHKRLKDPENPLPLSYAQQRLWFIDQLDPGNTVYNIPIMLQITGSLDINALQQAFDSLLQRHESLRTRISVHEGKPQQIIDKASRHPLNVSSLQPQQSSIIDQAMDFMLSPFDLAEGPLFRTQLLQQGDANHYLLLANIHHIIADGWSVDILMRDLLAYYQYYQQQPENEQAQSQVLPEYLRQALSVQYADYSIWQQQWLQGETLTQQLHYWTTQLHHAETLQLPTDFNRPSTLDHKGSQHSFELTAELSEKIRHISQENNVSLFMFMLTAFQLLLSRYSQQEDICVGTAVANRQLTELENIIGLFINNLVIRSKITKDLSFLQLLAQVKKTCLEAFEHQDLPFERLVEAIDPVRDMSQTPLFQVMFMMQNASEVRSLQTMQLGDLRIDIPENDIAVTQAKFDLTLHIIDSNNDMNNNHKKTSLSAAIDYRSTLFKASTIKRMAQNFIQLLESIVIHSQQAVHHLTMGDDSFLSDLLAHSANNDLLTQPIKREVKKAPRNHIEHELHRLWAKVLPKNHFTIDDNFFTVGGHSLKAAELSAHIRKTFAIDLSLRDIFDASCINDQALLIEQRQQQTIAVPNIIKIPRTQKMPLSFAQQRLWFLAQVEPTSPAYNMPSAFKINGAINITALQKSITNMLHKHELLRSNFMHDQGDPYLTIHPSIAFEIEQKHIDSSKLQALITEQASRAFDLEKDCLFRICLVHLNDYPQQYALLLNMHHIISDGQSMQIFIRELIIGYMAANKPHAAPIHNILDNHTLDIQYADYADWQRQWLKGDVLAEQINYWRHALANAPVLLPLPTDRPRPSTQSLKGALYKTSIDTKLASALRDISRQENVTLFMTCLAAFHLLLAKYSQQDDICVGIPLAGRSIPDTEDIIGFFVNALIIRANFSANISIKELLATIKSTTLSAFAHEHIPAEMLINELGIERSLAYTPIAQCAFNMMNADESMLPKAMDTLLEDINIALIEEKSITAKFDVQFSLLDMNDELSLSVEYSTDLFDRSSIITMADHYQQLLQNFAESPQTTLEQIQLGTPVNTKTIAQIIPLTAMQRDIYLSSLAKPYTLENSLGMAYYLPLAIDHSLWQHCLHELHSNSDIMRSRIIAGNKPYHDIAYQCVSKQQAVDYEYIDWSSEALSTQQIQERLRHLCEKPYDLDNDALFTYKLIKVGASAYWATAAAHHIIADGYSLFIQATLLTQLYEKRCNGNSDAPSINQQFSHYAHQSRQQFDRIETINYWQQTLAKVESIPSQNHANNESILLSQDFSSEHFTAIKQYCRQHKITPTLYFKCLYALLIHQQLRLQGDLLISEFNAGRNKDNASSLGCFYHSQPFCFNQSSFSGSIKQLFADARKHQKNSKAYLKISHQKLRQLIPAGDIYFSYNFLGIDHYYDVLGHRLEGIRYTPNAEKTVDLRVQVDEEQAILWLAYNSEIFNDQRLLERLHAISQQLCQQLCQQKTHNSDINAISELRYTLEDEQHLLNAINHQEKSIEAQADSQEITLVHNMITQQAQKTPHNIAVSCGEKSLSYAQLEEQSNALSHHLVDIGIRKGEHIAICLHHRVELITALLASIKSGACYVPIDPDQAIKRVHHILQDADIQHIITDTSTINHYALNEEQVLINVDTLSLQPDNQPITHPIDADDLFYTIYTSGSSGEPKGVSIYHDSEARLIQWYSRQYQFNELDRSLIMSSLGFDLTQKNFFAALTQGGTVYLPATQHYDPQLLAQLIHQHKISRINCAPSAFYPLALSNSEQLSSLKTLFLGGEAIQLNHLDTWISSDHFNADIVNMYGPTECTDISTSHLISAQSLRSAAQENRLSAIKIPLGTPRDGVTIYVLNEKLQALPPGFVGELYIAGNGLAHGYWKNPELTEQSFINTPLSKQRLYRSGDLVRIERTKHAVELHYIGRKDQQVKLNGVRIEPQEIAEKLQSIEAISDCQIILDEQQLIAFALTHNSEETIDDWRQTLRLQLPESMLPKHLVTVSQQWPLTANGKIDKQALLALPRHTETKTEDAPRNHLEEQLCSLWQDVLGIKATGIKTIGINDNFFDAGGDSLAAVRLRTRIEAEFNIKLPIASLFSAQTIAQLANIINNQLNTTVEAWSPIVPIQALGKKTPLFAVHAIGAMVLNYQPLSKALGNDQPFYGIQAYGFEDEQIPFSNLNDMLDFYVAAIVKQQPDGPYQIIGHSFGGLLAVEIVRRLRQLNKPVSYLALIDSHRPTQGIFHRYTNKTIDDAFILKTFAEHNFGLTGLSLRELRRLPTSDIIHQLVELSNGMINASIMYRAMDIIKGFQIMMTNVSITDIDVALHLIMASQKTKGLRAMVSKNKSSHWSRVNKDITLHHVPGDHHSMLQDKHVSHIAEKISTDLATINHKK